MLLKFKGCQFYIGKNGKYLKEIKKQVKTVKLSKVLSN